MGEYSGYTAPKIVAIGGGTGLSTMLRGLKKYTARLTAIVTMADDGGGSGVLREDLGMLPPGDIRHCLLALADIEPVMQKLFSYRFSDGMLNGQSFGNLFLAAMNGICGSFEDAVQNAGQVLAVKGTVIPVTNQDIRLCATLDDGREIFGESKISKEKNGSRISRVTLVPENAKPAKNVLKSIQEADVILIGPGSLYTSVISALLVDGVADAVRRSGAYKIYICNVMTQPGETDGYTAFDHASAILEHTDENLFDYCIVNTGQIHTDILERYKAENASLVSIDEERFWEAGISLIKSDMSANENDVARHNSDRLADAVIKFWYEKTRGRRS